jgi:hypothetical protein
LKAGNGTSLCPWCLEQIQVRAEALVCDRFDLNLACDRFDLNTV